MSEKYFNEQQAKIQQAGLDESIKRVRKISLFPILHFFLDLFKRRREFVGVRSPRLYVNYLMLAPQSNTKLKS